MKGTKQAPTPKPPPPPPPPPQKEPGDQGWKGIPEYVMLDVWMALGGDYYAFERMWAEDRRTPADTWAQLMVVVRGVAPRGNNPPGGPEFNRLCAARGITQSGMGGLVPLPRHSYREGSMPTPREGEFEGWDRDRLVETLQTQREMLTSRPDVGIYIAVKNGYAQILLPGCRMLKVRDGESITITPEGGYVVTSDQGEVSD